MPHRRSSHAGSDPYGGVRPVIRTFILSLIVLTGCAGPGPRCDLSLARDLSFTSAEAHDTITVRAFGPSCDKAIGIYEIRAEEGYPIWAWAAPLSRSFGDAFPSAERAVMRDFLERWASPSLTTTQSAPVWTALEAGQTTLDRLTYDDIRARDLPMLCHATGVGRETCVFWEPAAGSAGHFFDRDMEGA